jgi:hypothetical protein
MGECICVWNVLEWNVLECNALVWNVLEWNVLEWNVLEWNEWNVLMCRGTESKSTELYCRVRHWPGSDGLESSLLSSIDGLSYQVGVLISLQHRRPIIPGRGTL